ncbi:MAG: hypothetical protein ACRC9X_08175 [Bacteroidales bacterium]
MTNKIVNAFVSTFAFLQSHKDSVNLTLQTFDQKEPHQLTRI